MSIEAQIATLEALVAADRELKALTEQLDKERGEIGGVRDEVEQLQARLAEDASAMAEMDRTRKDLIQELRQMDKQIERSRDRLQRARNEREVNAAERELDELRKLQRDRDDEIKKIITLSDQAQETITANQARLAELEARLEGTLEGATKTISDLARQVAAKQEARDGVAGRLPSLTRRRYQSIHDRGRLPVATTHDGTCLGCYVKLPPMMFHSMLSRIRFEECPTCHRIIYYVPKPAEGEAAEEQAATPSGAEAREDPTS